MMVSIEPTAPLAVETNASDMVITVTLNQNERPVAFFSRTLPPLEECHSAVENKAYAIVVGNP